MTIKRIHVIGAIILFLLISLLAVAIVLNQKKPIKIGLIVSLTGIYPDLGREIRDGALLAVEIINEKGGIKGRPIELLVRDNKFNTDTTVKNIEELLKEGVVAIIGPATSSTAVYLLPIINQKKITVIAPTPTSTVLAGHDDYMIRMRPTNRDEAKTIADYIKNEFKSKKISLIYDVLNPTYSVDLIENLNRFLGDEMVIFTYPLTNKSINFRSLSKKILSDSPDIVIIVLDVYKSSMLIQNLRILKPEIPIFISVWAKSPKLVEFGGKRAEGVLTVDNIEFPLKGENGEIVRERFWKRYGRDMDFASVNGFDSVMILKKAIENGADLNNMKEVIMKIDRFSGIQGNIIFDKFGDRQEKPFVLKIENGKYEKVKQ